MTTHFTPSTKDLDR